MTREQEFAKRLVTALQRKDGVPREGAGMQTWLKDRTDVSHEAVRKWVKGISIPKPAMLAKLSQILEVDEAWLAFGHAPQMEPKERRARRATAEGAVNVVAGFLQLDGGNIAFPEENDAKAEYVDLMAIVRGKLVNIHVATAHPSRDGQMLHFSLPRQYKDVRVVGVIPRGAFAADFVNLDAEDIAAHASDEGSHFDLAVDPSGSKYRAGTKTLARFQGALSLT